MKTYARRLLSGLVALCLLCGSFPAAVLPALAADAAPATVAYNRAEPEAAILNANTGYDTSFYEKLKLNAFTADYARAYNAIGLFTSEKYKSTDYNTRVTDDDTGNDEGRLYYRGDGTSWDKSTLHTVAMARQNLAANLSATLYNRVHTHKCGVFKEQDVLAFEKVQLFLGNNWASNLYGSSAGMMKKYPRLGDYTALEDPYTMLNYSKSFNAFIKFEKSAVQYAKGTCTCGGAYAENMLLTFRDSRAPQIDGTYFSVDGGKEKSYLSKTYVGAGQTLTVRLHFDEPIRFADDTAAHGDLALILRVRGVTGDNLQPHAYLTKLDGNNLYFSYTVPNDAGELDVLELGLDGLYGKEIPLVQVIGAESFTLDETAKSGSKTGFSETTAYITDLAGNPITEKTRNCNIRIDTVAPTVTKVEFVGNTANADVKAALGKTDAASSDYTDASDRYLGEGDSLQVRICFGETANLSAATSFWQHAVAVTNIIVDGELNCYLGDMRIGCLGTREVDGVNYLTVTTGMYSDGESGLSFPLSTIPIHDNLRVADADGCIRVTAFEVEDGYTVTDLAGNPYVGVIAADANANPYLLDVTPPSVVGGSYAADASGDGFRYSFAVADDASGAAGIFGTFTLNNGGDGMGYPYEYAMSASPETPTDGWQRAATGTAVRFTQVECPPAPAAKVYNYLFVRTVDDADYLDFSNITLTVAAKDYAGNTGRVTLPAADVFDFAVDGTPPTAAAGKVSRTLSGDTGTLTVEVSLADKSGIAAWAYSTDGGATYTPGDITGTPKSFVGTASFTAPAGETTTKTLLVRATDTEGNTSDAMDLGEFTYDLAKAKYALDYSTAITARADLRLSALSDRDTVVFAVKIPASVSGADNTYAVLALTTDDYVTAADNLFEYVGSSANGWYYMTMTAGGDGNVHCRFDADADTRLDGEWYMPRLLRDMSGEVGEWWRSLRYGYAGGSVEVIVISGARTAFSRFAAADGTVTDKNYAVAVAGSDSDAVSETRVTLRVLAAGEREPYTDVSLDAVTEGLTGAVTGIPWSTDEDTVPATLEGVQLRLTIGADKYGYGYEDIDIANSYLRMRRYVVETGTYDHEYRVPLAPVKAAADGSATQIITIPSAKAAAVGSAPETYTTGGYELSVVLAGYVGEQVTVRFDGLVEVDATEPVDNRGFVSFRATPAIDHFDAQYDGNVREYLRDGVIYLPTAGIDRYDFAVGTYSESSEDADGNVTYTGLRLRLLGSGFAGQNPSYGVYAGAFTTVIWNTAEGYADHKVELRQFDREQSIFDTEKSINITNDYHVEVSAMPASPAAYTLYLKENADNVIAIQQIYANGKVGDIVYRTVHPVGGSYSGSVRTAMENGGELVFTPDADNTYTGLVRVYAGIVTADGTKTRSEMTAQADGTYRMPLVARETGGATYTVTAEDEYGNIFMVSPGERLVQTTRKAPEIDVGVVDDGNGMYGVVGIIENPRGDYTLRLDFDAAYAALLPESSLTLHLSSDGTNDFAMTALGGTGIYRVTSSCTADGSRLSFKLYGVALSGTTGVTATVSVTDGYGYTAEKSDSAAILGEEPRFESYTYGMSEHVTRFSQPVRPAASFTWQDGDSLGLGYGFPAEYDAYVSVAWAAAFPITKNGTQEISYYDVFGRLYTETVDAGTAFYQLGQDRSIDIAFSETALTGEAVTLTVTAVEGTLLVFEKNADGTYTSLAPVDGDARTATQTRRTVIPENAELYVCRYDIGDTANPNDLIGAAYAVRVYVTNIANRAPAATVYYRLEAAGREFTAEELAAYIAEHGEGGILESRGALIARYETSRTVTPTAGGSEFTFTAGGEMSHTFSYADDFGNAGSVTASVPAGLVLTARPTPTVDTEAPEVAVDIYAKRAGVLHREEAFRAVDAAAEVAARFDEVGDVQGYSLRLAVSDKSMPCTVSVTEAAGVTLSGNVLTVDAAADFTVTVTDAAGNDTVLTFTAAMLSHIDNIAPRAETEIVTSGLYTRDGYVRPYDVDASGAERADGTSEWLFPADAVTEMRGGKLWYKVSFTDNGKVTCVFRDRAGNYGEVDLTVADIDTRTPTLTQTFAPGYAYTEGGEEKYDETRPTAGPTKGSVSTHLDSDIPLSNVRVTPAGGYSSVFTPGTPAFEADTGVTVFVTETRITVTYSADYPSEIAVEAMAGNGRTALYTLGALVGVIDKDAPAVTETRTPLFRSGSAVPYGYRITLTPDEDAYCQNYGAQGTVLSDASPLVLEMTVNGTRELLFADKAGNITTHTVTVDDLDYTPPTLTVTYPGGEDSRLELTNGKVTVTVSADEDCTLTVLGRSVSLRKDVPHTVDFTENGTYTLEAVDAAGNRTAYTLSVANIDRTLPTIGFDTNTVFVRANEGADALRALLDSGYTAADNVTAAGYPAVVYDMSGVDLSTGGLYEVPYTVTDAAGNVLSALRFVRVIGADTLCLAVDGTPVLPGGTAVLRTGAHTLAIENLPEIEPGICEPYYTHVRRGIFATGQMKYRSDGSVSIASDGSFTVSEAGYYTLILTTQSRQTVRILLYVEN